MSEPTAPASMPGPHEAEPGNSLRDGAARSLIVDLFAGPGGWDVGAKSLGLAPVGIEWDAAACATRKAAELVTIRADVAEYPTEPFVGKTWGLIASPPCQDFSLAGKGAGIDGERGQLIWQVLRWADALRPTWIACEQVPPALPYWRLQASSLRGMGYRTWTGILNAADYGVPQTRKRAFLLAHMDRAVTPPAPTHSTDASEGLWGSLAPWVTMAQALGWTGGFVQRERSGDRSEEGFDPEAIPAQALTSKARSWVVKTGANSMKHSRTGSRAGEGGVVPYERSIDEPAPTLDGKVGSAWTVTRPATTVCADPRIFPPDFRGGRRAYERGLGNDPSQRAGTDAIRVTAAEASILQSFPPDYPWQGSRSKQFQQIGNAIPPLLAAHVLSAVTGLPIAEREVAA